LASITFNFHKSTILYDKIIYFIRTFLFVFHYLSPGINGCIPIYQNEFLKFMAIFSTGYPVDLVGGLTFNL